MYIYVHTIRIDISNVSYDIRYWEDPLGVYIILDAMSTLYVRELGELLMLGNDD